MRPILNLVIHQNIKILILMFNPSVINTMYNIYVNVILNIKECTYWTLNNMYCTNIVSKQTYPETSDDEMIDDVLIQGDTCI